MIIIICGSMTFAKEMLEVKEELEKLGHKIIVPLNTDKYAFGEVQTEKKWEKIEHDVIRVYFNEIKNSDAVLVINISKNNIENYIGGNSLMEMAFAHVLGKKIFLLSPIPKMNYTDEIEAMKPVILNGKLKLIK